MKRNIQVATVAILSVAITLVSCAGEEHFSDNDALRMDVANITSPMSKVRDYVPLYAVVAHRGSTYWAPEETEAAWRWARETGADYLESDLQSSKDGVVLANHDENLRRTTNIDDVYGDSLPATRADFYRSFRNADGTQHFSESDIRAQCQRDKDSFVPYRTLSYYYHELLALDAGSWFNTACPQQARAAFAADGGIHQYVSALQDQMAYARGKMLRRNSSDGERMLTYGIKDKYKDMTLEQIYQAEKKTVKCDDSGVAYTCAQNCMDFVEYDFANAYVDDPEDTGNRPGIYIEFKKPALNPEDMEVRVYNLLAENGWNIITKPEGEKPFYTSGKVNVGNTNGKVVMQTFSKDALARAYKVFGGKVPMCYLLWKKNDSTGTVYDHPASYASFIKEGLELGAHIMGPSISGAPGNYEELDAPWQACLIRRSGMLNHPYTFDTAEQMARYMGRDSARQETEYDNLMNIEVPPTSHTMATTDTSSPVFLDGLFTNRSDLTIRFLTDHGYRCNAHLPNPFHKGADYDNSSAPSTVPDAGETLRRLGY